MRSIRIALGIIILGATGMYLVMRLTTITAVQPQATSSAATSSPTPETFSATGTVIRNNPGFKQGAWYLVYEKPGAPGLTIELLFDRIAEPRLDAGTTVHVEGVPEGGTVSVRSITVQ